MAPKYIKPESRRQMAKATAAVNLAVKSGKIMRPNKCGRCNLYGKIEGHHHDYRKPLDVEWLCRSCHSLEHSRSVGFSGLPPTGTQVRLEPSTIKIVKKLQKMQRELVESGFETEAYSLLFLASTTRVVNSLTKMQARSLIAKIEDRKRNRLKK